MKYEMHNVLSTLRALKGLSSITISVSCVLILHVAYLKRLEATNLIIGQFKFKF